MKHFLEANYKTVHWGFLSAEIKPVLNINSGDEVEVTSVSGPPEVTKNSPYEVKESLLEIHEKTVRGTLQGGHICTGPIEVDGSKTGDVVEIEISSAASIVKLLDIIVPLELILALAVMLVVSKPFFILKFFDTASLSTILSICYKYKFFKLMS